MTLIASGVIVPFTDERPKHAPLNVKCGFPAGPPVTCSVTCVWKGARGIFKMFLSLAKYFTNLNSDTPEQKHNHEYDTEIDE